MYLLRRPVLDYRFPFFARETVAGSMGAVIKVFKTNAKQFISSWNPDADEDEDREPVSDLGQILIYQGMARISPNKDWRARKQEVEGQIAVEHAVRFQLDLMNNLAAPPVGWPTDQYWFPIIGPGDEIQVVKPFINNGMPVDLAILDFNYVVRNISSSSVSWLRTILCDIQVNDQSHGESDGYQ